VPRRPRNNSRNSPIQTNLTAWQATAGSQAFVADLHWSSTEFGASNAWFLTLGSGNQDFGGNKTPFIRVRAFRKLAL
jgi:hypothetical protein